MASVLVSTTITQEIWNLAKEKHIKWSEAMVRGIKSLANEEMPEFKGEKIEQETSKAIIEKQKRAINNMQEHILKLSDKLDAKENVV